MSACLAASRASNNARSSRSGLTASDKAASLRDSAMLVCSRAIAVWALATSADSWPFWSVPARSWSEPAQSCLDMASCRCQADSAAKTAVAASAASKP